MIDSTCTTLAPPDGTLVAETASSSDPTLSILLLTCLFAAVLTLVLYKAGQSIV